MVTVSRAKPRYQPRMSSAADHTIDPVQKLAELLHNWPLIEFAVLVGSRAAGSSHKNSDWDIAIQWSPGVDWLSVLAATETLRNETAKALQVDATQVDLIELRRANLAMRASVAEEGLVLTGGHSPSWAIFLRRTWRELEDFYWEQQRAA